VVKKRRIIGLINVYNIVPTLAYHLLVHVCEGLEEFNSHNKDPPPSLFFSNSFFSFYFSGAIRTLDRI